ncbi:MAG: hypothetical protein U9R17_19705 [Thermodesulfobacteriota bacterium]|nr:hypothetical protein [Thermodesulfobacteriota bacterium]
MIVSRKRVKYSHIWPIDPRSDSAPSGWAGWPGQKQFALVLQHDVEFQKGRDKCNNIMELEESLGFRSSFNFVPKRYEVPQSFRDEILNRRFEIALHGLKHDGRLFSSRRIFEARSAEINLYLKQWGSTGFSSPSMHHRLEWMHYLNISHATTTFDSDPFEPQPDGMQTVFPFRVSNPSGEGGYVELPYTLPQDHTLFIIMKEKNINIWKQKLDWIAQKGGMALLNTHPDYMNSNKGKDGLEEYPAAYYEEFLNYIKIKYQGRYWHALPKDMARFWSSNKQFA